MLGTFFRWNIREKNWYWIEIKHRRLHSFFQLLMFHSEDGGISKAAMIDALYGRVEVENKNGSLNNTIFRLRKQLEGYWTSR